MVIVAKSAGFCFGVKRAVTAVYNAMPNELTTYGDIIHNKTVINELKQMGVKSINSLDEFEGGKLVLRSHGVTQEVYQQLLSKNIDFIDSTCPDVKKIHVIVQNATNNGKTVIIIGDKNHPEVLGIQSFANGKYILIDSEKTANNCEFKNDICYVVVNQTTITLQEYSKILTIVKLKAKNVEICNTICNATSKRQEEAEKIAKEVDVMIVIGDKMSSNSNKLFEICNKFCKKTFFIETIEDLVLNNITKDDRIGLTAGASTPPAIIKEAVKIMSDNQNITDTMSFAEMLEESFVTIHTGDIVKGTVIQIANGEVSVNLGYKSDGVISRGEFSDNPDANPKDEFAIGDEIQVYVIRVNDGEGNVLLSRKKVESMKYMDDIEEAFNNKEIVEGKVIETVKGGLIALIKGMRIFVPSSQISNRYVEDLNSFKGKELKFNIIEFDKSKRRIVAGRKELAAKEQNEKRAEVFKTLEAGQKIEGTVSRIVDFGAFVDLGGVDGLIHISQLSWGRVKKVTDILKEGDKVTVTVLEADKEKSKISLSLKDVQADPWASINEKYPVGTIAQGKVVRMVNFGAFVELEAGIDGLVHVSQISHKHIAKPEDELKVGELINVKITEINMETKKISLSKKEAEEPTVEETSTEANAETTTEA